MAYQQTGLVRRTLARGDDGEWLVETLWYTAAHSDAAAHADAELDALIDASSIRVRRWHELDG